MVIRSPDNEVESGDSWPRPEPEIETFAAPQEAFAAWAGRLVGGGSNHAFPDRLILLLPWTKLDVDGYALAHNWLRALAGEMSRLALRATSDERGGSVSGTPSPRAIPLLISGSELADHLDAGKSLLDLLAAQLWPQTASIVQGRRRLGEVADVGEAGGPPWLWARKGMLADALERGQVILMVSGLADLDLPEGGGDGEPRFLDRDGVRSVLAELARCGVRRVITVARGSFTGRGVAWANKEVLEGFAARWLFAPAGFSYPTQEWQRHELFAPEGAAFRQIIPLREAERSAPTLHPGDGWHEACARRYLTGKAESRRTKDEGRRAEDNSRHSYLDSLPANLWDTLRVAPRLERTFLAEYAEGLDKQTHRQGQGLARRRRWTEAHLAEWLGMGDVEYRELHRQSRTRGLVLLDGDGPNGGQGKTTALLALLALAHMRGLPAVYVRAGDLVALPGADEGEPDDLLELALRHKGQGRDEALRAHLQATGVLLLVDGLDEVSGADEHSWLAEKLAYDLTAPYGQRWQEHRGTSGVHVMAACRTEQWHWRKEVNTPHVQTFAARVREALAWIVEEGRSVKGGALQPPVLEVQPLSVREARKYLTQIDPDWKKLLRGNARLAPVLAHPLSVGLLGLIDPDTLANYARRTRKRGDPSQFNISGRFGAQPYLWDVVRVVVRRLVATGLASSSMARDGEGAEGTVASPGMAYLKRSAALPGYVVPPLGVIDSSAPGSDLRGEDGDYLVDKALRYLERLALAMAEEGVPLSLERAREVIIEEQRGDLEREAEELAARVVAQLIAKKLIGRGKRHDAIREAVPPLLVTLEAKFYNSLAPDILTDLCVSSLVLEPASERHESKGYVFSHNVILDVLCSDCLMRLSAQRAPESQREVGNRALQALEDKARSEPTGEAASLLALHLARNLAHQPINYIANYYTDILLHGVLPNALLLLPHKRVRAILSQMAAENDSRSQALAWEALIKLAPLLPKIAPGQYAEWVEILRHAEGGASLPASLLQAGGRSLARHAAQKGYLSEWRDSPPV